MSYFDRDGNPMAMEAWAGRLERGPTHIGDDTVTVGDRTLRVSTVWLGINHQWNPDLPPLIFETMVFDTVAVWNPILGRDIYPDVGNYQLRYSTEAEALAGHQATVELVRVSLEAERDALQS